MRDSRAARGAPIRTRGHQSGRCGRLLPHFNCLQRGAPTKLFGGFLCLIHHFCCDVSCGLCSVLSVSMFGSVCGCMSVVACLWFCMSARYVCCWLRVTTTKLCWLICVDVFRLTKPVSHPPSRGGSPPSAAGLRWIVTSMLLIVCFCVLVCIMCSSLCYVYVR